MEDILVSVVIPMYNSQATIERCINSVLNQTHDYVKEIIVIDDGSTDMSAQVVQKIAANEPRIMLITKENGGVSSARNIGMKKATGNYIALLDSDDEWLPQKLERQLKVLQNNPNIDFIGCNRNNENTKILFKRVDKLYKVILRDLLIKIFPHTSTAIFKRHIITEQGIYYDENQKYGEDGNFWMHICVSNQFFMMPDSLVITKGGKPNYGHSGLSSNLVEMHKGELKNLREMKLLKYISTISYTITYLYIKMKYYRRILIVKLKNKKNEI